MKISTIFFLILLMATYILSSVVRTSKRETSTNGEMFEMLNQGGHNQGANIKQVENEDNFLNKVRVKRERRRGKRPFGGRRNRLGNDRVFRLQTQQRNRNKAKLNRNQRQRSLTQGRNIIRLNRN